MKVKQEHLYPVLACWTSVLLLLLSSIITDEIPIEYSVLPFAASVLFLGLPHGAVDHLIPKEIDSTDISPVGIIGMYLVLMVLYALVWYFTPVIGIVSFILLTLIHWGQGDLYVIEEIFNVDYTNNKLMKILIIAIRGSLPMLVPLVSHPSEYKLVISGMLGLFGENSGTIDLFFTEQFTSALLYSILTMAVIYFSIATWISAKNLNFRGLVYDLVEFGILFALFFIVNPILAIGVYFCFWHSLRHIIRIIRLDGSKESVEDFGKFLKDAMPMTLITIIGALAFSYVAFTNQLQSITGLLSIYLLTIAIVTLPHFVVAVLMDINDGIW